MHPNLQFQLWKGLDLKVRKPQLFILAKSCDVLEVNENGVLREVSLKDSPSSTLTDHLRI